jgi:hypothetical protein
MIKFILINSRKFLITVLFLQFFLCSCSRNLSRKEAANLIIKYAEYPKPITYELRIGSKLPFEKKEAKYYNLFKDLGLINIDYLGKLDKYFGPYYLGKYEAVNITLTELGKKFVMEEDFNIFLGKSVKLKYAEKEFDEVTGIAMGEGFAEVKYRWKITIINPSGGKGYFRSEEYFYKNSGEGTAYFRLYDDGWRVIECREEW